MLKYSNDNKIVFDSKKHTYTVIATGKILQGVTSLISKFKQPFESDRIAAAYALKHGLKKEEVLAAWKLKGETSRDDGTRVHKFIEDSLNTQQFDFKTNFLKGDKCSIAGQFLNDYFATERLKLVQNEVIVYNEHLATQIDCLCQNKQGDYFNLDWKTNEKIDFESFRHKKMNSPFEDYDDCSLNHYSIQLQLGSRLSEWPIKDSFIVHIGSENYELIRAKKIFIPTSILNYEDKNCSNSAAGSYPR